MRLAIQQPCSESVRLLLFLPMHSFTSATVGTQKNNFIYTYLLGYEKLSLYKLIKQTTAELRTLSLACNFSLTKPNSRTLKVQVLSLCIIHILSESSLQILGQQIEPPFNQLYFWLYPTNFTSIAFLTQKP